MQKQPNPIDVHVGTRIRLRRMMQSMSQEKLGEHLGITFQQVQKYEKGTNRVSASKLQAIAGVLQCPVSWFFEDAPAGASGGNSGDTEATSRVVDFLSTPEGIELNRAFQKITDPKIRRRVVELVRELATNQPVVAPNGAVQQAHAAH